MIKGEYEKLQSLAKYNICAKCHMPLTVAWHATEDSYFLRCGGCEFPDTLTRQLSLTQEYKAGADIPEPIKSNIERGLKKRAMQQANQPTAVTLGGVPATDLGSGELLAPEVVKGLVDYAKKYHLDPARGHVVLMYGKPYVTIDGYLFHANRLGIAYSLNSRPMTTDNIKAYKIGETDYAWIADVSVIDTGAIFTGIGIVTYNEMTAKSPRDNNKLRSPVVAAHPWQLAQKRAEWQALRRAFPIGDVPPWEAESV